MSTSYTAPREVFGLFKDRVLADAELASQLRSAIIMLRSAYNTAIRENRFIVGGAVEHILVGAFNGARLPAVHVGVGNTRIDLRVQGPKEATGFSTKASFSTFSARLINTLGSSEPTWEEPTIFLFSRVGIVYADPELLPNATNKTADALVLNPNRVKAFIDTNPTYVLPMDFDSPEKGKIASSKTASEDVARSIVKNFPRLSLP